MSANQVQPAKHAVIPREVCFNEQCKVIVYVVGDGPRRCPACYSTAREPEQGAPQGVFVRAEALENFAARHEDITQVLWVEDGTRPWRISDVARADAEQIREGVL